jgi:short-subunit dehydrogenase
VTLSPTLFVLGGSSDIGFAVASTYASEGWNIVLAVRDPSAGERNAKDLETRFGIEVQLITCDVCSENALQTLFSQITMLPDTVVSVVGSLGAQARTPSDPHSVTKTLRTNFEGPALLLEEFGCRMAARGSGTIVGVSSVAGDRGRGSNYIYGSAKAGFTAFLSGLRNRLAKRAVHVLTVKPGFVRTRMTKGLSMIKVLTAEPSEVGKAIYHAAETGKKNIIYVKPIWRMIMMVINCIPEFIFKRLNL